ncbi:MAG: chromate resistance protein [Candidatus Eremiobacteraeota bacterium]|nr:chromate resistance protein [Candidatus Eremiobacteraeota bacterium]
MTFVTRARARVDRMACPWLIRRFIDPAARILFVPADLVFAEAAAVSALPFDVPGVELGHHGDRCSFDAFLDRYDLDDPALRRMALIVRGADTDRLDLVPEAAGLFAIATGFQKLMPDRFANDDAMLEAEMPMYDALYEFCRSQVAA